MRALLAQGLGVHEPRVPMVALSDVRLPASRLDPAAVAELAAVVGADHALSDDETRVRHTRGKSLADLLRLRAGEAADAPDLVLLPGSHDEVLAVLRICSERRIAVVPFGGGTSVVGGLEPAAGGFAGVVAIDLRRMNALVELDEQSRLAVLEPGLRAPQAEALLNDRGFTIGHFPQSFEYLTLGGAAAARSSGQASAGYGRFDDLVLAMRVATPTGTLELGRAPKSAAGPDLRQLILGSEGAFGVITSLTVALRPVPEERVYDGWRFESFWQGADAVRRLVQDGPRPTVLRLSDEAETALNLARPSELGDGAAGCLAIAGYEGSASDVAARRHAASADAGGGWWAACAGRGRDVGARSLSRALPARRAARRWRFGRDARDGRVLVGAAAVVRGRDHGAARVTVCAGSAARRGLPHLARVRGGSVAVLHRCVRATRRPRRAVARRKGRRR